MPTVCSVIWCYIHLLFEHFFFIKNVSLWLISTSLEVFAGMLDISNWYDATLNQATSEFHYYVNK